MALHLVLNYILMELLKKKRRRLMEALNLVQDQPQVLASLHAALACLRLSSDANLHANRAVENIMRRANETQTIPPKLSKRLKHEVEVLRSRFEKVSKLKKVSRKAETHVSEFDMHGTYPDELGVFVVVVGIAGTL